MRRGLLRGAAAAALTVYMAMGATAGAQGPHAGFYIGGHVGGGEADYDGAFLNDRPDIGLDPDDLDLGGFAGGFHLGYNFLTGMPMSEFGVLMLGVEGDATFMNWRDVIRGPSNLTTAGIKGDVDLLASVRGRLGVVSGPWLVFVTGGVAFSDAFFAGDYDGDYDKFSLGDVGGVVGGGVEYAFSEMVSVRLEGLYYIFDDKKSPDDPPGTDGDYTRFDNAYVIRGGLSISLGQLFGYAGP
jgi:opacity protein-like surface antigen